MRLRGKGQLPAEAGLRLVPQLQDQYGKTVPSIAVGAHCLSLSPTLPPASFRYLNEPLKLPLVLNFLICTDGDHSSTYVVGWL